MGAHTVAAGWTGALLQSVVPDPEERGAVLRDVGLRPETFADPDNRVDARADTQVWIELARRRPGRALGLRFGAAQQGAAPLGLLGFLTMSSRTVGEALDISVRHHALIEDAATTAIRSDQHGAIVRYMPQIGPRLPDIAEAVMATRVSLLRAFTGTSAVPTEVCFVHDRPRDVAPHHDLFGCPVRFGAAANTIAFDRDTLDLPLRTANADLRAFLESLARRRLDKFADAELPALVRTRLDEALRQGTFALSSIARQLGVSSRTLQRRLAEHGASFHRIVSEARFRRALELLEDTGRTTEDIAATLGFADARGFRRAFRRWSGLSPRAYRARARPRCA
jgi:AraC-like DNA-binding protein